MSEDKILRALSRHMVELSDLANRKAQAGNMEPNDLNSLEYDYLCERVELGKKHSANLTRMMEELR